MNYLVVLIRIATIIPMLLIVTLLMGKRLVGEPYEAKICREKLRH